MIRSRGLLVALSLVLALIFGPAIASARMATGPETRVAPLDLVRGLASALAGPESGTASGLSASPAENSRWIHETLRYVDPTGNAAETPADAAIFLADVTMSVYHVYRYARARYPDEKEYHNRQMWTWIAAAGLDALPVAFPGVPGGYGFAGARGSIAVARVGGRAVPRAAGAISALAGSGWGSQCFFNESSDTSGSAPSSPGSPTPTGQVHHPISRTVHDALQRHPRLAGLYSPRDPRFVTQAADLAAHRGYQTWHREIDAEVVSWIDRNPSATPAQFEAYLRSLYARPDLAKRFPGGF